MASIDSNEVRCEQAILSAIIDSSKAQTQMTLVASAVVAGRELWKGLSENEKR